MSPPRGITNAPPRGPGTGTEAVLARILEGLPRLDGALCSGRAALFDGTRPADVARARRICLTCPALAACSEWSANRTDLSGVVAGRLRARRDDRPPPPPRPRRPRPSTTTEGTP